MRSSCAAPAASPITRASGRCRCWRCSSTPTGIARALGVDPSRLMVTGDDAIDLAHAERPESLGEWVGVNLRVARSADVDERYIDMIGRVVSGFAAAHDVPLAALPIGRGRASDDVRTIQRMLAAADGATIIEGPLDTTQALIEQAGRCRIVV